MPHPSALLPTAGITGATRTGDAVSSRHSSSDDDSGKPDSSEVLIPRPRATATWKGARVEAVGNRLFLDRPPNEPFHEFLMRGVLPATLGDEWFAEQDGLPEKDRHPVWHWLRDFEALYRGPRPDDARNEGGGVWSIEPDAPLQALLSLAYDIYLTTHTGALPERLIERLRSREHFQGVAYEIHVAGIFARTGFEIDWQHAPSIPHPEFVAIDKARSVRIAVEAKSRHRDGILGFGTGVQDLSELRTNVGRHLAEAIRQAPGDVPFVVFVDLNLPPSPDGISAEVFDQIKEDVSRLRKSAIVVPVTWSAIVLTNSGWHWPDQDDLGNAYVFVLPEWASHPLELADVNRLAEAVQQRSFVPHDDDFRARLDLGVTD